MAHEISLIFVSNGRNPKHRRLTQQAVDSALESTSGCSAVVIDPVVTYANAKTIIPVGDFNYNGYLNQAAKHCNTPYLGFFNNDVLFYPNWFNYLVEAMKVHSLDSASPLCPITNREFNLTGEGIIKGYEVRKLVCGWALVLTKEFYKKIGGFDEGSKFWCSDNRYQKQLIKHKGKHGLVLDSKVKHLGSQTLKTLKGAIHKDYTVNDVKKFNKEFNEDIFGWGT